MTWRQVLAWRFTVNNLEANTGTRRTFHDPAAVRAIHFDAEGRSFRARELVELTGGSLAKRGEWSHILA
jgi:hypothetical protein